MCLCVERFERLCPSILQMKSTFGADPNREERKSAKSQPMVVDEKLFVHDEDSKPARAMIGSS